ncbi:MAG: SEC-C metal-binding domain-containing protein, partial [Candidatus Binataceae bacterium]
ITEAHGDNEIDPKEWDWKTIEDAFFKQFKFRHNFMQNLDGKPLDTSDDLAEIATERIRALYDEREQQFTAPVMRQIEKVISLQTLDSLWKDHLLAMDHLKEGIGLRGYGQLNPLVEYQKEGFTMFEAMMATMQQDVIEKAFSVQITREQDVQQMEAQQHPQRVVMSHGGESEEAAQTTAPIRRGSDKVGRNDPCPCGSGKKYKRCHGK